METAKDVIKKYGRGFYRSTLLFPKDIREVVWALYQFVRLPDEVVDSVGDDKDKDAELSLWEDAWKKSAVEPSGNAVVDRFREVAREYVIPDAYVDVFFSAMRQDITKDRYETYAELEAYMYGSATVVGYMMTHIVGAKEGALPAARALAEAFQMTNFLRDIKSDYDERGRIYLPKEDMERFGVTEAHIRDGVVDDAWRALMAYEVARARALYAEGVAGISLLSPKGQKAVYAAALIYNTILRKIERARYDVFTKRLVVSPFYKSVVLLKALCTRNP